MNSMKRTPKSAIAMIEVRSELSITAESVKENQDSSMECVNEDSSKRRLTISEGATGLPNPTNGLFLTRRADVESATAKNRKVSALETGMSITTIVGEIISEGPFGGFSALGAIYF
jgi:hypothetical protein